VGKAEFAALGTDMTRRISSISIGLVLPLVTACASSHRDDTDHDARSFDARVRMELDGTDDHQGSHVEAGWRFVDGDVNGLEYRIDTATLGMGLDATIAEHGWFGVVAGLSWQRTRFETAAEGPESDAGLGPYVALEGGWELTPQVEPYARADAAAYLPDASTTLGLEAGVRVRIATSVAAYVGWRHVWFDVNDLDHWIGVDQYELEVDGLVARLEFGF